MDTQPPFFPKDQQTLAAKGISLAAVLSQIETFKRGLPFITLHRPCTVGDGIASLSHADLERYTASHVQAARQGRLMKFVPASGAASRMFQFLLSVADRTAPLSEEQSASVLKDDEHRALQQFLRDLKRFAFYDDLRSVMARDGLDIERLISQQRYKAILNYLLTPVGLNYANLPKALIKFHRYADHTRTAAEEHLVEAGRYARNEQGLARVHFTVSPEHREAVHHYLIQHTARYEREGQHFALSFSVQQPSTDTIAVDQDNNPFRTTTGELVFRPGGHGALLVNLQELNGDIIFIKNIDNIVPDRLKAETYRYKQALSGYLCELQKHIFHYLQNLLQDQGGKHVLTEVVEFMRHELYLVPPRQYQHAAHEEQRAFLVDKLNRPLRICGVVKNTGEPGGGPFWVTHANGEVSAQIVESSQIDLHSPQQQKLWASASHFNPVDLVCGVKDYWGRPFNLAQFVDPDTGFISRKSKDGKELKALELPGLWNGAMAKWNTVFVEVPAITFNPVKTVFDLLRPEHQDT